MLNIRLSILPCLLLLTCLHGEELDWGIPLVSAFAGYQLREGRQHTGSEREKWHHFPRDERHYCDRTCLEDEEPITCKFQFHVELYNTLAKVRRSLDLRLTILFFLILSLL